MEFSGYSYFFMDFSGCFAGFGELFCGIQRLQLLFMDFSGCFAVVWGAVLWISAVTATFFQNFSSFWAGLGSCFRSFMDYSGIKIHSRKNDCEFFYEKNGYGKQCMGRLGRKWFSYDDGRRVQSEETCV